MKFEVYGNMLRQERHEIEASSADEAIKLIEQREHGSFQSIDAVRDEEGFGWDEESFEPFLCANCGEGHDTVESARQCANMVRE